MKYKKLPILGTTKYGPITISIYNHDVEINGSSAMVMTPDKVHKLWRIMSCPTVTRQINIIETHDIEDVVCRECTPSGRWSECQQPYVWYRITHSPTNTYLEVCGLLFHEIIHHGLEPPMELKQAIDQIPDSHLDIDILHRSRCMESPMIQNPDNWPIIHVLPMYYNYGIYCMAPKHLAKDNNGADETRQEFIHKLSMFADCATVGDADCIATMRRPLVGEPIIGSCPDCEYVYDNYILILRDWDRRLQYRLDRASSHAIRRHKVWVPEWFRNFIMTQIV